MIGSSGVHDGELVNEPLPDPLRGVAPDLAAAIRRARLEQAQRSDAVAEIHSAEVARLELLQDAVRPILAQVPAHVDMFDAAVSYGDQPRLFIDMIGFVELGHDNHSYRLVQDTRHGRLVMAETDGVEATVEAVAAYVARRLVEREKALAADTTAPDAGRRPSPNRCRADVTEPSVKERARMSETPAGTPRRRRGRLAASLRFVIEFLGTATLLCVVMGTSFMLYHAARAWLTVHHGFAPE